MTPELIAPRIRVRDTLGCRDGGEEEDRTPDLCIANAALSQLSYPPTTRRVYQIADPPTPALRGRRAAPAYAMPINALENCYGGAAVVLIVNSYINQAINSFIL